MVWMALSLLYLLRLQPLFLGLFSTYCMGLEVLVSTKVAGLFPLAMMLPPRLGLP
jgi:hypothetical protein